MGLKKIVIRGARQHNLKNIHLEIPRNTLTVITGLSGSGKSSLAFDTLYAEGQRRYVESLSAYARQFWIRWSGPRWIRSRGFPFDRHRAEDHHPLAALDGGNDHGDLRLSARGRQRYRHATLPEMRETDHAAIHRTDRPSGDGLEARGPHHGPRAGGARAQGRVQKGTRKIFEKRLRPRAGGWRAGEPRRTDPAGPAKKSHD